jgi:hypothetical protein
MQVTWQMSSWQLPVVLLLYLPNPDGAAALAEV